MYKLLLFFDDLAKTDLSLSLENSAHKILKDKSKDELLAIRKGCVKLVTIINMIIDFEEK